MKDQVREMTCIVCPNGCRMTVTVHGGEITVTGNTCKKGEQFAREEMTHPMRTISSTVATSFPHFPRLPVKTKDVIPKEDIFKAMEKINEVVVTEKVRVGDVIIPDVCGTDIVATEDIPDC